MAEKSATQFRPVDELWLAIQCSTRISEMLLELTGVEDFASVPTLEPYAFSRVFVFTFTGAYEWRKGEGWRKLTADSPAAQGPSFDDLKNVLCDPEWLDDPEGNHSRGDKFCDFTGGAILVPISDFIGGYFCCPAPRWRSQSAPKRARLKP